jgi:hypothetical protein
MNTKFQTTGYIYLQKRDAGAKAAQLAFGWTFVISIFTKNIP